MAGPHELSRRLEDMAHDLATLTTQVAVMAEREKQMADRMAELEKKIDTMRLSIDSMGEIFTKSRGALYVLSLLGASVAAIAGFWDRIPKPWPH